MSKPKMALYWGAGCGGCEISVLEIHERILELIAHVDVVFWPCVLDYKYADLEAMPDQSIDLCLFNGALRDEDNVRIARLLRSKSKVLVAYGACAAWGGIPGLANLHSRQEICNRAFVSNESTDNPEGIVPATSSRGQSGMPATLPRLTADAHPLRHGVEVDFLVPGCPPSAEQTWNVCEAFLSGNLPAKGSTIGAGDRSVCDECRLERKDARVDAFKRTHEVLVDRTACLLEQGIVCCGPATRSGCDARCPSVNMPCRGCYGPSGSVRDPGAKMMAMLASLVERRDPAAMIERAGQVVDPAGTFYRFTLASCVPGRACRDDVDESGDAPGPCLSERGEQP